ncbi:acetyl-CoA carboxylase biotin carboxyl carrier protein [soil metagenome]
MAKKGKEDADQSDDLVAKARGLAEIVSEHHLTELIIESGGTTITVRREITQVAAPASGHMAPMQMSSFGAAHNAALPAAAAAAPAAAPVDDKSHVVTSPFVGTFYRKPNPDSANYVAMGDKVAKGAVLCIVEAMKLMNEIEADAAGTIVGILVEDGTSVEYGQALFKIKT